MNSIKIGSVLFLGILAAILIKTQFFKEEVDACQVAQGTWSIFQEQGHINAQINHRHFAVELAKLQLVCANRPLVRGKDYYVNDEVFNLSKDPDVMDEAKQELKGRKRGEHGIIGAKI